MNARNSFLIAINLLSAAALSGCAERLPDTGLTDLRAAVGPRAGGALAARTSAAERAAAARETEALLEGELTLDGALKVALLNAPHYQGLYARMGVAAADRAASGALTNPVLSAMARPTADPAGLANLEFSLLGNLLDMLTRPARVRAAAGVYEAETLSVAAEVAAAAAAVRTAYLDLVAASNLRAVAQELHDAAAAAAALAERFHAAGNIPLVRLREEQAAAADAALTLADAETAATEARERLALLMGVDGGGAWRVPALLPAAPEGAMPEPAGGLERRLDVRAARAAASAAVATLKLRADWRLWRDLGLDVSAERDGDGQWAIGPRLAFALPVFNQGRAEVARAAAEAVKADQARAAVELSAASELRLARAKLAQAERRLARYRTEIVPLHSEIVDLKLREYNYMFIGAFEVLVARQAAAAAEAGYVAALRDVWKARLDLDVALGGGTAFATPAAEPRS